MRERGGGFTLVELSIVLVIIGLLIGGILVARSMIEATRVTAQIKQFQQFDVAVSNFKNKFGGIPGDSSKFPGQAGAGNDDGVLESMTTGQTWRCDNFYGNNANESANFWNVLSTVQPFPDGKQYAACPGCSGGNIVCPGINFPLAPIYVGGGPLGANAGVVAYGAYSDTTNPTADGKNYYSIIGAGQVQAPLGPFQGYVLRGAQLQAIDSKMDDGNPLTGKVVARKSWSRDLVSDNGLDTNAAYPDGCLSASRVNLNNYCLIRVDMLSSAGESQ